MSFTKAKGAVIIYGRGWWKFENRLHSKFAPLLGTQALRICPPLGSSALKFCPPLPIGANTFTCKFTCSHGSIVCITDHAKITYHIRYSGKSSGIVLNVIQFFFCKQKVSMPTLEMQTKSFNAYSVLTNIFWHLLCLHWKKKSGAETAPVWSRFRVHRMAPI